MEAVTINLTSNLKLQKPTSDEKYNVQTQNTNMDILDSSIKALQDKDATLTKQADFETHTSNKSNPHNVTKEQLGLSNVVNQRQIPAIQTAVTDGGVPVFDGNGYTLKDSGFSINESVPANAKFTDTVYLHPESGISIGEYSKVVVDTKGHIIGGSNPTTLAGYGITDAEPLGSSDMILTAAKDYADSTYVQSTGYTDSKVSALINGAPSTLDTLKEIADAMEENQTVVEALETAIGNKTDEAEFQAHQNSSDLHVSASEKAKWDGYETSKAGIENVKTARVYKATDVTSIKLATIKAVNPSESVEYRGIFSILLSDSKEPQKLWIDIHGGIRATNKIANGADLLYRTVLTWDDEGWELWYTTRSESTRMNVNLTAFEDTPIINTNALIVWSDGIEVLTDTLPMADYHYYTAAYTVNTVFVDDIVNNLYSTDTNKPLSAKQGRVLDERVTALENAGSGGISIKYTNLAALLKAGTVTSASYEGDDGNISGTWTAANVDDIALMIADTKPVSVSFTLPATWEGKVVNIRPNNGGNVQIFTEYMNVNPTTHTTSVGIVLYWNNIYGFTFASASYGGAIKIDYIE